MSSTIDRVASEPSFCYLILRSFRIYAVSKPIEGSQSLAYLFRDLRHMLAIFNKLFIVRAIMFECSLCMVFDILRLAGYYNRKFFMQLLFYAYTCILIIVLTGMV